MSAPSNDKERSLAALNEAARKYEGMLAKLIGEREKASATLRIQVDRGKVTGIQANYVIDEQLEKLAGVS